VDTHSITAHITFDKNNDSELNVRVKM
jgi:hypothetical protein